MIVAVATLLTLVAAGAPAALLLDPAARWRLRLAESYLLGCGLFALALFALSMVGVPWSLFALAALILPADALFLWLALRKVPPNNGQRTTDNAQRSGFSAAVDLVTLLTVAGHARFATMAPLGEWDFWAIWGLKARVFWERGGVDWTFLESPANEFTHPDYPLLLPLVMDSFTLARGGWEDRWIGILFTAFALASILLVRALLEEELGSPLIAALGALAVSGAALSDRPGIAEGPLAAYMAAGILLLRRGWRDDDASRVRAGAVMLGLAALTKNEGVAMIVAVAAGSVVALGPRWREAVRLWPAAALAATWLVPRAFHALPTDLFSGATWGERVIGHLTTLPQLAVALAKHPPAHPLLMLAIAVAIAWRARLAARRELFALGAILVQLIFYLGSYIVGPHEFEWHVATSWARLVSQIEIPLAFVAMTLLFVDEEPHERRE